MNQNLVKLGLFSANNLQSCPWQNCNRQMEYLNLVLASDSIMSIIGEMLDRIQVSLSEYLLQLEFLFPRCSSSCNCSPSELLVGL